jgi:hypothetical protein
MIQFSAPVVPGWHDDAEESAGAGAEGALPEHAVASTAASATRTDAAEVGRRKIISG